MKVYVKIFLLFIVLQVIRLSWAASTCVPLSDLRFKSINGRLEANNGVEIKLKGANWWGFETGDQCVGGLWTTSMAAVLDYLQMNGFNALRIPYSSDLALNPDSRWPNVNSNVNPTLNGKKSMEVMDQLFDMCADRGILLLLDNHRFDPSEFDSAPLWYSAKCINNRDGKCVDYTEASLKTSLGNMVKRYQNMWNFLGLDLLNEPHGDFATWGTGNLTGDWNAAAERIGDFIIDVYPDWHGLIFVEGNSDSYNCELSHGGHWWGGNLEGVRCAPVQLSQPERLVYSPHVYGPSVYEQPYFSSTDMPNNLPPLYQQHFGFVANLTGRAVVVGEWGGPYTGTDAVVQDAQSDFFVANGFGSFYWAVNPNPGGDTDGLLLDDWKSPNTPKLTLLAKTHPDPTTFSTNSTYICINARADNAGVTTIPPKTTTTTTPPKTTTTTPPVTTTKPPITTTKPPVTTTTPPTTTKPPVITTTKGPTTTTTPSTTTMPTTTTPAPSKTTNAPTTPSTTQEPTTVVTTTKPPGSEGGKYTTSTTPPPSKRPHAGGITFNDTASDVSDLSMASTLPIMHCYILVLLAFVAAWW